MVTAYILAVVSAGEEKAVLENLKKAKGVKEMHTIYGEYDLFIKIEVDDISDLNNFVLEHLRPHKSIERTTTLIAAT